MTKSASYTARTALIVALGGFLMGFDASVISGVVSFVEVEFQLTKIQLGWAVASLSLAATFAMLVAGPISDRLGRKPVLQAAALLFAVSAVWSALAGSFVELVLARMLGGFGVGAALIIAPMFIAEMAPAQQRGRLVSFNQLNIVLGISAAFMSNYLILQLSQSPAPWAIELGLQQWPWRWMLMVEAVPAVLYFVGLRLVPESPRWLIMRGDLEPALAVLTKTNGADAAPTEMAAIQANIATEQQEAANQLPFSSIFSQPMRLVLAIGLSVAVLQQITGINSVFFYAPMIFEQSGIGTDAAFMQAVVVGLTNLAFTVVALMCIDRIGRKPLLIIGVSGITCSMLLLAWVFGSATYVLSAESISALGSSLNTTALESLREVVFDNDIAFKQALASQLSPELLRQHESQLISAAIQMNPMLVLGGIIGFVASFAISLGPVMWVLFSELFPNRLRAAAISFVGFINSAVSFLVQLLFPWQLANLGTSTTFLIYGMFAFAGLLIILRLLPETRGKSLEQIEQDLVPGLAAAK
ncbi:MFS transporter [Halieaceae bacterium IMCC14734]|uniref:MFS transporter n=1 Tax=Candidatus Litorirhabdus singularis TaxID=2518993 RepID=A0ABT3TFI5_9GAMM|nr:sugar porter family MFS transporter [Candidatus Litorirhabdus singularis]MCX2980174.1 MFS transporter [Candidatus Litorirhabdus singularis]